MTHNFVKQSAVSKVCGCCGDERGTDADRDCPHPIVAQPGNYPVPMNFIELCPPHIFHIFFFKFAFDEQLIPWRKYV